MKPKTILELMTLSTNLYMISKDRQLLDKFSEMGTKGKEKLSEFMEGFESDDGQNLSEKIMEKATQAKEELEQRIGEMVVKLYDKMNIAHTEQIEKLTKQIESLKDELVLAEARIIKLESLK